MDSNTVKFITVPRSESNKHAKQLKAKKAELKALKIKVTEKENEIADLKAEQWLEANEPEYGDWISTKSNDDYKWVTDYDEIPYDVKEYVSLYNKACYAKREKKKLKVYIPKREKEFKITRKNRNLIVVTFE